MAAKQGLTAHLSQASEDAKRAVLSRAPTSIKSHSWLSNLNTTCTIKSAPPRTPEVMAMLAVKSGWLVKRNEQHVWQRRYCCVVPHTFLYYFEAEPAIDTDSPQWVYTDNDISDNSNSWNVGGGRIKGSEIDDRFITRDRFSGSGVYSKPTISPVVNNQDALNAAVRDGYVNNKNSISLNKSSIPFNNRGGYYSDQEENNISNHQLCNENPNDITMSILAPNPQSLRGRVTSSTNLSPVGIIDLECYTNVNRSLRNDCVFELTGDAITNPDLRSFYFQAGSIKDCELWTKALLSDRHSALRDEREAYRQVCDSFQLQLQSLSDMIDEAESKQLDAETELYRVRSAAERARTSTTVVVREVLERRCWNGMEFDEGKDGNSDESSLHSDMENCMVLEKDKSTSIQGGENDHNVHKRKKRQNGSITRHAVRLLENTRVECLEQLKSISVNASSGVGMGVLDGIVSSASILADYLGAVVVSHSDLTMELVRMEERINNTTSNDRAVASELREKIEKMKVDSLREREKYETRISVINKQMMESGMAVEEAENQLKTQRMEFTIFQNQAKSKLQELTQHKKILKREVIELRKRIDEVGSERDAALHRCENLNIQIESEREKNNVLTRYVEKVEKQVNIQQNMMEMMSQTGGSQAAGSLRGCGGSVVGRYVGPDADLNTSEYNEVEGLKGNEIEGNLGPNVTKLPLLPPPIHGYFNEAVSHTRDRSDIAGGRLHQKTHSIHTSLSTSSYRSPIQLSSRANDVHINGIHSTNSPLSTQLLCPPGSLDVGCTYSKSYDKSKGTEILSTKKFTEVEKDRARSVETIILDRERVSKCININSKSTKNDILPIAPKTLSPVIHLNNDNTNTICKNINRNVRKDHNDSERNEVGGRMIEGLAPDSVLKDDARVHRIHRYRRALTKKGVVSDNKVGEKFVLLEEGDCILKRSILDNSIGKLNSTQKRVESIKSTTGSVKKEETSLVSVASLEDGEEDDHKSQVSELTEDRTQRTVEDDVPPSRRTGIPTSISNMSDDDGAIECGRNDDVVMLYRRNDTNPSILPHLSSGIESKESPFPPSYILGVNESIVSRSEKARLPDISTTMLSNPFVQNRHNGSDEVSLAMVSIGTTGSSKLSVAHRARLEAENSKVHTLNVPPEIKARLKEQRAKCKVPLAPQSPSIFSNIGKSIFEAIDNSSIGFDGDGSGMGPDNASLSSRDHTSNEYGTKLTLAERQKLQRERQLQVLKKKGIIKDEVELKGGAGAGPQCDSSVSSGMGVFRVASNVS